MASGGLEPNRRMRIAASLSSLPGAESRRFFIAHGLGRAYSSAGEFSSRGDKVNAGLEAAEREGRLDDILLAAEEVLGVAGHDKTEASMSSLGTVAHPNKVFVSHAAADGPLADAIVDFLVLAGVPRDRIFYTSQRSTGIATGA